MHTDTDTDRSTNHHHTNHHHTNHHHTNHTNHTTQEDTDTMYALLHDRPITDISEFDLDLLRDDRDRDRNAGADGAEPTAATRAPQARCADGNGTLTHLFFSDDVIAIARAKAICSKCKLSASCLEGALERSEPWGVWGGELIENGRIVADKRPRGRPPKHPRPIVIIDEVPIPPHLVA